MNKHTLYCEDAVILVDSDSKVPVVGILNKIIPLIGLITHCN